MTIKRKQVQIFLGASKIFGGGLEEYEPLYLGSVLIQIFTCVSKLENEFNLFFSFDVKM